MAIWNRLSVGFSKEILSLDLRKANNVANGGYVRRHTQREYCIKIRGTPISQDAIRPLKQSGKPAVQARQLQCDPLTVSCGDLGGATVYGY